MPVHPTAVLAGKLAEPGEDQYNLLHHLLQPAVLHELSQVDVGVTRGARGGSCSADGLDESMTSRCCSGR